MYSAHCAGTLLSWKIASTGHSGTQASQSIQWSGSITVVRVDVEHVLALAETITGADRDAVRVLAAVTRFGDDKGHVPFLSLP